MEPTAILLDEGWNLIAYYPEYELSMAAPDFTGISGILEHVALREDGKGFLLYLFAISQTCQT